MAGTIPWPDAIAAIQATEIVPHQRIVNTIVLAAPEPAAVWLEMKASGQPRILSAAFSAMANRSPEIAAQTAAGIAHAPARLTAVSAALEVWFFRAPSAAAAWLNQSVLTTAERRAVAERIGL